MKNIQIKYKCSQILTIEPQIFMPNPYAASIYGQVTQVASDENSGSRRLPDGSQRRPNDWFWIPESPKRNGSIVFPTGIDSMWQQRQPIWSPEPDLFESVAGNLAPLIWLIT